MADKTIKISAKLDTASFDREIEQMQRRMKQMTSASETTGGGVAYRDRLKASGIGQGSSEAERQRAAQLDRQSKIDQEKYIKEQIRREEELGKIYNTRLDKIKKINEEMAKGLKNELEGKREISRLEQRNERTGQAMGAKRDFISENISGSSVSSGGSGRSILSAMGRNLGIPGIISALGGGLYGAANINSSLAASQRIANTAQGNATQGFVGEQVQNAYSGNLENILFRQQRGVALKNAASEERRRRVSDALELGGGVLGRVGAGAATGATLGGIAGGVVGSAVPFVGTAVGAGVGAKMGAWAGGVLGGGAAGYDISTDPKKRSMIADREMYEKLSRQREAGMVQENYQAELMKDPTMTAARRAFASQSPQNLGFQRQMGMADQQFYSMMDRGDFTKQQLMGESSNIMGAGGSTRAARGLGGFANQLSRDYDLTNASQIIGKLSGTMGSAGASQNATMKMLSESFKAGLDSSEFREENRKFMSITSEMAFRSGATSPQGAESIAGMFSKFMASPTSRGMEAAQSAMQVSSGFKSESGGARGAIGAAAAIKEGWGKTSADVQNFIQTVSPEQLESGAADEELANAATEMYGSASSENIEKAKKSIRRIKSEKMTVNATTEKARQNLKNMKGVGVIALPQIQAARGRLSSAMRREGASTDASTLTALSQSEMAGEGLNRPDLASGVSTTGLGENKAGDAVNSAMAQEGRVMNQLLKGVSDDFKASMGSSSKAVEEFTRELIKATEAFKKGDKSLIEKLYDSGGKSFFSEEQPKADGK